MKEKDQDEARKADEEVWFMSQVSDPNSWDLDDFVFDIPEPDVIVEAQP